MGRGDLAHDGKPESAARCVRRVAAALESLHHLRTFVLWNAGAVIFDLDQRCSGCANHAHGDLAARLRVANRIVDQVPEQLLQQQPVPHYALADALQLSKPRSMPRAGACGTQRAPWRAPAP